MTTQDIVSKNAEATKKKMEEAGYSSIPSETDSEAIKSIKGFIQTRRPTKIKFDSIKRDDNIRRTIVKDKDFELLKASIKENGVLQSIVVQFVQIDSKRFSLKCVAGHRRLEALYDLKMKNELFTLIDDDGKVSFDPSEVPVQIISANSSDRNKIKQIALSENVHRQDLHFIEIADTYKNLMDSDNLNVKQIADRFDKSQKAVERLVKLSNNFPENTKQIILENRELFPYTWIKEKIIDTKNINNPSVIASIVSRKVKRSLSDDNLLNKNSAKETRKHKKVESINKKLGIFFEENGIKKKEQKAKFKDLLMYFGVYPT